MRWPAFPAIVLLLAACGGDPAGKDTSESDTATATPTGSTATTPTDGDGTPLMYRFIDPDSGDDTVSYDGQVFRQLLIDDMADYIEGLTADLDSGRFPAPGDVSSDLLFYLEFDSAVGGVVNHRFSSDPPPLQLTYDDVSSDKNLFGKLAGNDPVGQHADWSTAFVGWPEPGIATPESLVRAWVAELDARAVDWSNGVIAKDLTGAPVPAVYITEDGRDLKQLLAKFTRGAVAFSQGTDDYLDDDEPGKGLLSDHTAPEEGEPYTALEHAWDEGFGYFGAARDYPAWTDADIAEVGVADSDGDGAIDLHSEVCWGHSVNAAKRDLGAVAATDYTADAWRAFARGRLLIAQSDGPLEAAAQAELAAYRDDAVLAWERAIAATVVHYINDVLQDMGALGTPEHSFGDHAQHWSELKGFALALQFNPRSPLTDADFAALHGHLGTAPVFADTASDHADQLRAARSLIGTTYGFNAANLGDSEGRDGW
ncbi:MAG: hypothetical protein ACI8PZ_006274 [Myxococcota bacterium]|jgi:hypothetical protein